MVASEVKNLAAQTAKATDEIAAQIGSVRQVAAESGRSSTEVRNAAAEVSRSAVMLQRQVETFLAEVKAA